MRERSLKKTRVIATIVRLLEQSLIRVGNDEYAKENESFGLSTLKKRHALVKGAQLVFQFRGKSGIYHAIKITDGRIARTVRRCQELPGQRLFQYYLGNTAAVCRKSYIHPAILEEFAAGRLTSSKTSVHQLLSSSGLSFSERELLRFLRRIRHKDQGSCVKSPNQLIGE
jgi:DNA topoisomerase IB